MRPDQAAVWRKSRTKDILLEERVKHVRERLNANLALCDTRAARAQIFIIVNATARAVALMQPRAPLH